MRNRYLKTLALVMLGWLIFVIVVYVSIAFSYAKFNPFDWVQEARASMAFISAFIFFFTFIIAGLASSD